MVENVCSIKLDGGCLFIFDSGIVVNTNGKFQRIIGAADVLGGLIFNESVVQTPC